MSRRHLTYIENYTANTAWLGRKMEIMIKIRKVTALFLSVLMLAALCACGHEDDQVYASGEADEYVYVASYTELPDEVTDLYNCCWFNDGLYFIGSKKSGTESYTDLETGETVEYDNYVQGLFYIKQDGTGLTELQNYNELEPPEGMQGGGSINSMAVDAAGNLWVCENLYAYVSDDGSADGVIVYAETTDAATVVTMNEGESDVSTEPIEKYYIRKLDETGAELLRVDLSSFADDAGSEADEMYYGFYPSGLEFDSAGNIYFTAGQSDAYVLDGTTGEQKCKLTCENGYMSELVRLADGRIAAMLYRDGAQGERGQNTITLIDPEAKDWGEDVPVSFNAYELYPGGGDYDYYYNIDSNFYGATLETGEGEKLFNWINCDIDSNDINIVVPLADGRVLCVLTHWTEGGNQCELAVLTKTEADQVQQKTVLTYACMYVDYNLRSRIIDFNKTNEQYRIEVADYSEYNTEDDYDAGLLKLSTEIIGGKVPDVISTSQLPIQQYAAKGLLEDLWPYIEADPELGREAVVEPVFQALEQDGKLYQVTPSFSVYTVAGSPALVGDTPGWTLDELYAALDQLPEGAQVFSQYTVRDDILQQCCAMAMDEFVNWETGVCSFDSPEFIQILEFAASFPAEFDWDNYNSDDYESEYSRIQSGKQLLSIVNNSEFQEFLLNEALFGGEVTFIGFPTTSGNGSAFQISSGLAMSSSCADKEGAWQFIRTVLNADYQEDNVWEFPTNQAAFDAKLEEATTPIYYTDPETGEQVEQSQGGWGWDELMVEMYALKQEQADQVLELINSTNRVYSYDQEIFDIISDDAGAFFEGQKSAEETAALIQNRVSLYVNEQM